MYEYQQNWDGNTAHGCAPPIHIGSADIQNIYLYIYSHFHTMISAIILYSTRFNRPRQSWMMAKIRRAHLLIQVQMYDLWYNPESWCACVRFIGSQIRGATGLISDNLIRGIHCFVLRKSVHVLILLPMSVHIHLNALLIYISEHQDRNITWHARGISVICSFVLATVPICKYGTQWEGALYNAHVHNQ